MKIISKTILVLFVALWAVSVYSQSQNNRPSDWAIKITNSKLLNLYMLNDSIYRCEQPDSLGFTVIDSIGIKSILNLRSKQTDSVNINNTKLNLYNVEMLSFFIRDKEIIKALKIIHDSPKPIIVHCKHGSDRTGIIIAMYRIIYQDWPKEKAIIEMKEGGYGFHEIHKNIIHYIKKVKIEKIKKKISK